MDGVAPATREPIDTEDRRIIEECCEQTLATLRGGRDRLDRLTHTLMEREPWTKTRRTPQQAPAATQPSPRSPAARQENHRGNQEWRCQAADAAGVPTGRARIWLSAAVRTARGSLAAAGYRQATNRSGRTTIAPSLAICRWRCQAQRGSW